MASEEPEVDPVSVSVTLSDLLQAWSLQKYEDNFTAEAIDIANLNEIVSAEWSSVLEKLIPVAGHRIRFVTNVKQLLALEQIANTDSDKDKMISPPKHVDEEMEIDQEVNNNSDSLVPGQSKKRAPAFNEETNSSTSKRQATNGDANSREPNSSAGPLKSAVDSSNSTVAQGLRDILMKSGSGRCLLALSKKSGEIKQDRNQTKLAELIIEHVIVQSPCFKINTEEFPELVKSILSLFPREKPETYYIPYKTINHQKCLAKGKLINKYYQLRKELKSLGEISGSKGAAESDDEESPCAGDLVELEQQLNFLKDNVEPWDKVVENWKSTHEVRMRHIQAPAKPKEKASSSRVKNKAQRKGDANRDTNEPLEDVDTSLHSYLATFPALKTNLGYTLFEEDFNLLYPGYGLKIYSDFEGFSKKVVEALNKIEKKPPALQELLDTLELDGYTTKDGKDLAILSALCYLDTVVNVARRKKEGKFEAWRPPQPELQEGVISLVPSVGRMETFITKRYNKFADWNLPVQPFCVAVGPDVDNISQCFVVLDRVSRFSASSPIRALDICFKVIHAMNAAYSEESFRLWMLIQKGIYGLTGKNDHLRKPDAQLGKLLQKLDLE